MAKVGDKFQFTHKECISIIPAQDEWPSTYTIIDVDVVGRITCDALWDKEEGFTYNDSHITILKEKEEMFKVGDSVLIAPSSEYYTTAKNNPKDTKGTVDKLQSDDAHTLSVKWDNGHTNTYRDSDLIHTDAAPLFTTERGLKGLMYVCGGTTLTKSSRRTSMGEEQYVIKYGGASGNLNVVKKSDLPALAAAIIELL